MSAAAGLLRQWQSGGVVLNAPATDAAISALAMRLGVEVPVEFIYLYSAANGMAEHVYDAHWVSFWPIERMMQESPFGPVMPFADFLIESWRFVLHAVDGSLVVFSENVPLGHSPRRIGSFGELLRKYTAASDDLGVL